MAKSAAPIQIADAWLALVGRAVGIAIVTCAVSDIALVWTKIRVSVLARALAQIHNIKQTPGWPPSWYEPGGNRDVSRGYSA